MKKVLLYVSLPLMLTLSSCLKDKGFENNEYGFGESLSDGKPLVQILEGGLFKFKNATLKVDPNKAVDTAYFSLYYFDNDKPTTTDITVTLAYSATILSTYNANNPSTIFEKLPDSTFKFITNTVVIKAGQKASEKIPFIFFPNKINSSKLYLFPISIITVSDSKILVSSNNGTRYINVIGNPLAGDYNTIFSRWNYTGSLAWGGPRADLPLATGLDANNNAVPLAMHPGGAAASFFDVHVVNFAAVDGQTISGDLGNVPDPVSGTAQYLITANTDFTEIKYDFAATFNNGYSNIDKYIRGYVPPTGGQKPAFRLITKYNNAATGGNVRIVDETFRHL